MNRKTTCVRALALSLSIGAALSASPTALAYAPPNVTAAKLVTKAPSGSVMNGGAFSFGLSKNGRYVVFESGASDFVPGVTPGNEFQIFWLDRKTGATKLVSRTAGGQIANADCSEPRVSDDGKRVVFLTLASNLGAPANGKRQVCYADVEAGTVEVISRNFLNQIADNDCWYPEISGNGRVATFSTYAPSLLLLAPKHMHVLTWDSATGQMEFASVGNDGTFANEASLASHLSDDGRYVTFETSASNLPEAGTFGYRRIVTRDRKKQKTFLVSKAPNGDLPDGICYRSSMTGDGRYVGFLSLATNLTKGNDAPNTVDVFVTDRDTGKTWRMAGHLDAALKESPSDTSLSEGGRRFALTTLYTNPNLANVGNFRVHVYDRISHEHALIEATPPATATGTDTVEEAVLAGNGKSLWFLSRSKAFDLGGSSYFQMLQLKMKDLK